MRVPYKHDLARNTQHVQRILLRGQKVSSKGEMLRVETTSFANMRLLRENNKINFCNNAQLRDNLCVTLSTLLPRMKRF